MSFLNVTLANVAVLKPLTYCDVTNSSDDTVGLFIPPCMSEYSIMLQYCVLPLNAMRLMESVSRHGSLEYKKISSCPVLPLPHEGIMLRNHARAIFNLIFVTSVGIMI